MKQQSVFQRSEGWQTNGSQLSYVRIRTKKELRSFALAEGRQGMARLREENLCTSLTLHKRKTVEINRNAPDCNPNFIR